MRLLVIPLVALLSVTACSGDDGSETEELKDRIAALERASSEPGPTPVSSEPAAATESLDPRPQASASPRIVDFAMPSLVGANLQDAQNEIQRLGVFFSVSHDLLGSRMQVLDSNWKVCTQTPEAGSRIAGPSANYEGKFDFGTVKLTEDCPQRTASEPTAPLGDLPDTAQDPRGDPNGECQRVSEELLSEIASKPAEGVGALILPSAYQLRGEQGLVVGGFLSSEDGSGRVDGEFGTWFVSFSGSISAYTDAARELTAWPRAGDGAQTDRTLRVRDCAASNAG